MTTALTSEAEQLLAQAQHLVLQMRHAAAAEARASAQLDDVLRQLDALRGPTGVRLGLSYSLVADRIDLSRQAVAKRIAKAYER